MYGEKLKNRLTIVIRGMHASRIIGPAKTFLIHEEETGGVE